MKLFNFKLLMAVFITMIIGCQDKGRESVRASETDRSSSTIEQESLISAENKETPRVELFLDTTYNWKQKVQDLADTTNFNIVKEYIKQKGNMSRVSVSSSANDTSMMVTYHTVYLDSMEVVIDHSNRIYMNENNRTYGNILKEKATVVPEIIYGVPDTNAGLTKEREIRVLEIYSKLLALALDSLD